MISIENVNYYKTSDIALATTISLSFPVLNIDRTNSRKVLFIFEHTPELGKLVERFWRNELLVEPQRFFNQLKNIKSRIYGE